MKNDRGKRVFIVVLILIFCVLFLVCGDRETVFELGEYALSRKLDNDSVYIESRGGGSLFVGGGGKLSGADLKRLMSMDNIKTTDITDIDLSDGITEIGYAVANGYMYLETLRLGDGAGVVHNGAVKNCTSLQYVYLPRGLKEVGQDFMFNCNGAFVVTDAMPEELPEMPNVPQKRVLADVHSYEDLVQRRSDVAVKVFAAAKLTGNASQGDADPAILSPGSKRVSPSFALSAGAYALKLIADAPDKLTKDDVSITVNGKKYDDFTVETEPGALLCMLTLERRAKSVKFKVVNHTNDPIEIVELRICKNDFVIPEAVKAWWQ